ncbi:MAG: DNA repair protein RecO [Candidatus Melainabacteria bacterium RIFCSPHIGHO2_02_FULL_34_12]|nr:MAG: DNA repair protein RecO [Candidatus Melainabacteria bacterium RIFCSPHIGHO2_02_FULL_34_12]
MPTYNDYGIVLTSYSFSEADKILNIYTRNNGLVRAIGKGIKKPTSRFGGKTGQLSCCYFHFAKGKNLDILSDCEQINAFPKLRGDLIRLTYGMLFVEIVSSFAYEMESESTHIYELLYSALDKLQITEIPDLFSIRFIMEFLSIHGFRPQLETCVSCSKNISYEGSRDYFPFSSILGGLLCNKCSHSIDHKKININVLQLLGINDELNNIHPIKQEDIRLALELVREHTDMRGKNKIKTFDLVFSL